MQGVNNFWLSADRYVKVAPMSTPCDVSIVIPIHNERLIVADSVAGLLDRMSGIAERFQIVLAENGSSDGTLEVVQELERRHAEVTHLHIGEPNYGRALREGILAAKGELVICDEIDLCDSDFHRSALGLLRAGSVDMVVGSKLAPGSRDERPYLRHLATQVLNGMLRVGVGFKGTDTHGLKAFRRERLLPVVRACLVEDNLFASELVIRAERAGVRVVELPVTVREKRRPTINLFQRVPGALVNLGRLVWIFRVQDRFRK
jgi:glycosyltransferase involved in cell wall biosynthesis